MVASQSGAASPTPSGPPPESLFGSIPPSISASPLRTAGQLPPLPASPRSRPAEEVEPEQEPWRGSTAVSGDDTTPVSSPRRAKKALSPERPAAGSSRSESRSKSPPSHQTSKDSSPSSSAIRGATLGASAMSTPQTPRPNKTTHTPGALSVLKPGASPGAWSTLATPGMEDNGLKGTPAPTNTKGAAHVNGITGSDTTKKITGFLSRLYGTASSGANGDPTKTTPSTNGHVPGTANGNGAIKHSYIVEEPGDDDDDDGDGSVAGDERGGTLPPVYSSNKMNGDSAKRQDSWSSTVATRGDAPSRTSSWGFGQSPISPNSTQEDDEEEGSDVAGDSGGVRVVSKEAATSLPGVPIIALPEVPAPDNANNPDEASDVLAPLPASKPLAKHPLGIPKKVHFTPSVVGGLSSIASSSPPSSPSGTLLSLGSRVPLPPSDSSDAASSDEQRVIVGKGDAIMSTSEVEEPPLEEYRVPQPPSLPACSETSIKESPPPIPFTPTGSHSRTPSAGTIPLSFSDSPGDSSPPGSGSLSPRLRSTSVPPISATHHHHMLPSVPTGPAVPASSSASSSSSVTAPLLPPPPPLLPLTSTTEPFSAPAGSIHTAKYPPTPYRPAHLLSLSSPSTVTPPALPQPFLPEVLEAEETNRAKKHAKFAISALDYDDLDTARKELVSALKVLGVNIPL